MLEGTINDFVASEETQSQSILTGNIPLNINTPLQMAQLQMAPPHMQQMQYGQHIMGFQPPTQQMQTQSIQQPLCSLPDFEIDRIAARLKEFFFADLEVIIAQKVNEKTDKLSCEIDDLRSELSDIRQELRDIKSTQDEAEQYSRRTCVRIGNYKESQDEDTDSIVIEVAKLAKTDIKPEDIDRSHRVNRKPDSKVTGPREIIVKFNSYKSRTKFIIGRKQLRESKSNIFLNEDLTNERKQLAYECRLLKKDRNSCITQTWSRDGNIYVKDNRDKTTRIKTMFDIEKFRPYN